MIQIFSITCLNSRGQGIGAIASDQATMRQGLSTSENSWLQTAKHFVNGTIPGERVLAKIETQKKDYGVWQPIEILQASDRRVEANCPHYGTCGACNLMHLSYDAQQGWKQRQVASLLQQAAIKINSGVLQHLASPAQFGYRQKVSFAVAGSTNTPQLGLFERDSNIVIETDHCAVIPDIATSLHADLKRAITDTEYPIWNSEDGIAGLRAFTLRIASGVPGAVGATAATDPQVHIVCTVSGEIPAPFHDRLASLLHANSAVSGVSVLSISPQSSTLLKGTVLKQVGQTGIGQLIGDRYLAYSPTSFFQVNVLQAQQMLEMVHAWCHDLQINTLLEMFCGSGLFALSLAPVLSQTYGLDIDREAIKYAQDNATHNNINNAFFFAHDLYQLHKLAPSLREKLMEVDIVVLDPPRKGLGTRLCLALGAWRPKYILYVSCNPNTAIKDLRLLCGNTNVDPRKPDASSEGNYQILRATVVDMFPQTTHIESMYLLQRRN